MLCKERFYAISKLVIKIDGKRIKDIKGLPLCVGGYYLFESVSDINFVIPENANQISIIFKLEKPYKKKRIAKYYLIENNIKRRRGLWN